MKRVRQVNEIFLLTVIIALAASYVFGAFPFIQQRPYLSLLLSQAILALPVIVYLMRGTDRLWGLLPIRRVKISNVFLLVLFAAFISPLLTLLNALSLLFTTNRIMNTVSSIVSTQPLILSLLMIAVIPAVLEETIYRGVFFQEYRKINPRLGVVLSGLLFGFMHMNFNQFIYAFVMGMIFAVVVEVTDSLVSSMIIHFTINGSSVVLTYLMLQWQKTAGDLTKDSGIAGQAFAGNMGTVPEKALLLSAIGFYGVVAVFSTVAAFWILKRIARNAGRPEALRNLFTTRTAFTIRRLEFLPLGMGIALCFAVMVYQQYLQGL